MSKLRRKLGWTDTGMPVCDECVKYMMQPGLIEACASVGIEHNKSTSEMLRDVVNSYHDSKHT